MHELKAHGENRKNSKIPQKLRFILLCPISIRALGRPLPPLSEPAIKLLCRHQWNTES